MSAEPAAPRRAFTLIAAAFCLLLAGCAEDPLPAAPETDAQAIQYWLEAAHNEDFGAPSDHMIEALERALARGTVVRADIDELMPEYYDCLGDAGLEYNVVEDEAVTGSGISVPGATIVAPDEDSIENIDALSYACEGLYRAYVVAAYTNQPTSREAQDRVWLGDAMRACLAERGLTMDADATAAEIRELWDEDITANLNKADNADYYPC